ncbi:MAG: nucleotidyltransferase family protein [Pseudomonadota bacterium]
MKALLLAAGLGTRLRPITNTIPKCLVPIHGFPLLGYWFDLLFAAGFERVLVNTHYFSESVERFVATNRWREQIDLVFEENLLGTGGTVKNNVSFFAGEAGLVAHADNLSRFDVAAFLARHRVRPSLAEITMMTFDTDAPKSCGIVEEDRDGLVQAFHEKSSNPPSCRANGAVFVFEPSVFDFICQLEKDHIEISTDVLPRFLGRICTFLNNDYHRDIGTPEGLALAEREFSRGVAV